MKKIAICGITGKQGGAVYEALKNSEGWVPVGFSRSLEQPRVKELQAEGVCMLTGDLTDLASLESAFEGAECVFGLTQPWNKGYTKVDTGLELKQGKNIIDACIKTGVKHLVFSSAAHAENEKTGLPHVDVKIDIEDYGRQSGIGFTILSPVQFMDNVGMKFLPVKKGKIRGFIDGQAMVPYVAVRDIGLMAKIAFLGGETFYGRQIPLIGDLVSGKEVAALMGKIRKESFKYKDVPKWIIWVISREFYKMRLAFEKAGTDPALLKQFQEGIDICRKINPDMLSMEAYLLATGWDQKML